MKHRINVQRLSNVTVFKLLLIGNVVATFACIIIVLLGALGELLLEPPADTNVEGGGSIILNLLGYLIVLSIVINVSLFLFYGVSAIIGLWIYSKFRPIEVTYFDTDSEKI